MVSSRIHRKGSGLKVCYLGCSVTNGDELENIQDLWAYQLDEYFDFDSQHMASNGNSNANIFKQALDQRHQDYDIIFLSWTRLFRVTPYPQIETQSILVPNPVESFHDSTHGNFVFTKRMKQQVLDLFILTNNTYNLLKDVLDYSLALQDLDDRFVFFNTAVDQQFNTDIQKPIPKNLSELQPQTQELLDFNNNSDHRIIYLMEQLQNKYNKLDTSRWLNIFPSIVDRAYESQDFAGEHPGTKTHKFIFEQAKKYVHKNFKSYCEKRS